jgi:hypothetical protein
MTPFPGYYSPTYQNAEAPGGGQDPRQASDHWSFSGPTLCPKAQASRIIFLPQAAARQWLRLHPYCAPIVAGPRGPGGELGAGTGSHLPGHRSRPHRSGQGRETSRTAAPTWTMSAAAGAEAAAEAGSGQPGPGAAGWIWPSVGLLRWRRSQPPLAVRLKKRSPPGPRTWPPGREHAPPIGKFRCARTGGYSNPAAILP